MIRVFILFGFIFIFLGGCKKEYPAASGETPVFYFNGTVNGVPVNIQAGVNNYYMFSSFTQDSNNVYNFLGELKPTNCINCNNKIKFQINDYTSSPINGTTQITSSLLPSYYSMQDSVLGGSATQYAVYYSANDSLNNTTYTWDFGDGTSETGAFSLSHVYNHPGYYNACLTINDLNGCSSNICKQIKVAVPDAACEVSFVDSLLSGNTFSFSANGNGTPSTYLWDFGDGSTSNLNPVSHTYSITGIFKVSLKQISNTGNCTSYAYKNISTQGFSGCQANFNFSVLTTTYQNPLSLSNSTITWTDNSGIKYTSNNISQINESYFQIVSVENYLNNENNQPTKKLHIKFNCTLSNGNNSIQINNGDAVIGVSYR